MNIRKEIEKNEILEKVLEDGEQISACMERSFSLKHIAELWNEFGNIPMDPETECMDASWHGFPRGTHREDIWRWFESQFPGVSVADLMYGVYEKVTIQDMLAYGYPCIDQIPMRRDMALEMLKENVIVHRLFQDGHLERIRDQSELENAEDDADLVLYGVSRRVDEKTLEHIFSEFLFRSRRTLLWANLPGSNLYTPKEEIADGVMESLQRFHIHAEKQLLTALDSDQSYWKIIIPSQEMICLRCRHLKVQPDMPYAPRRHGGYGCDLQNYLPLHQIRTCPIQKD
ncbi:MAG: hypothetical protein SPF19_12135 [Oliverpabstia sp.]|nr:hypothetical protein [Oliverpabstia sp.]